MKKTHKLIIEFEKPNKSEFPVGLPVPYPYSATINGAGCMAIIADRNIDPILRAAAYAGIQRLMGIMPPKKKSSPREIAIDVIKTLGIAASRKAIINQSPHLDILREVIADIDAGKMPQP